MSRYFSCSLFISYNFPEIFFSSKGRKILTGAFSKNFQRSQVQRQRYLGKGGQSRWPLRLG